MPRLPAVLLLLCQGLGLLIALAFVALTFLRFDQVESRLRGFAMAKVEAEAERALEAGGWTDAQAGDAKGKLAALAARLGKAADERLEMRDKLVPALVERALQKDCDDNCKFGTTLTAIVTDATLLDEALAFQVGERTVQDLIVDRYQTTVDGLVRDLRQFGLVNAVAFSLMIALVVVRHWLNWRFAALSVVMTGYTAWAMHGYLFRQNWAQTILFQEWAGPAYQFSMIVVCLFFCDWLFLRGVVTRAIGNLLASMIQG